MANGDLAPVKANLLSIGGFHGGPKYAKILPLAGVSVQLFSLMRVLKPLVDLPEWKSTIDLPKKESILHFVLPDYSVDSRLPILV